MFALSPSQKMAPAKAVDLRRFLRISAASTAPSDGDLSEAGGSIIMPDLHEGIPGPSLADDIQDVIENDEEVEKIMS